MLLRARRLLVLLARRAGAIRASRSTSARHFAPDRPDVRASRVRFRESRIVDRGRRGICAWPRSTCRTAARTSPRKMQFLAALARLRRSGCSETARRCVALRRSQRRAHRPGRASEGAQARRDRPAARGARAASSGCSAHGLVDVGRRARLPTTTRCSPGGRRGATCGSATSAGASTTCWRRPRSRRARRAARCSSTSARAITRR